jgi:protein phosphatase 1 regulatory subunit 7
MGGLGQLKELQQLWLGRNRIQSVNLCGLTNLLKISLQSNRLTSMAAFQVSLY